MEGSEEDTGERERKREIRLRDGSKQGKEGGSNKGDEGWDEWSTAATG